MPWIPPSHPPDEAGHGLQFSLGATVGQGHVPQGALGLEIGVDGYHGHPLGAVPTEHRGDHVVALVPGKVDVQVRRVHPGIRQESLEHEVGGDGVHVGDPQQVADDGGGAAAPTTGAGGLGLPDDVVHGQKVACEPLTSDEVHLQLDASLQPRGSNRIATRDALPDPGVQLLVQV